jgi:cysteine synthase
MAMSREMSAKFEGLAATIGSTPMLEISFEYKGEKRAFLPHQFSNPEITETHYIATGQGILAQLAVSLNGSDAGAAG